MRLERVQLAFEQSIHWGLFCTHCHVAIFCPVWRGSHSFGAVMILAVNLRELLSVSFPAAQLLAPRADRSDIMGLRLCRRLAQKCAWLSVRCGGPLHSRLILSLNRTPIQVSLSYAPHISLKVAYWEIGDVQWAWSTFGVRDDRDRAA